MTKDKLIHTEHLMNSVIEVYLTSDKEKVYQIKCLTGNRCRQYNFNVTDYIDNQRLGHKKVKLELENLVN